MIWSSWKHYYSDKYNICIFKSDSFPEEPQYWKDEPKKQGRIHLIKRDVLEGNPYTDIRATRIIGEDGERDPEIVEMIEEILKKKIPVRIEERETHIVGVRGEMIEVQDWHWDYQLGAFVMPSCALGENFYDYGEDPVDPLNIDDLELKALIEQYPEYFCIEECGECCRCAGW